MPDFYTSWIAGQAEQKVWQSLRGKLWAVSALVAVAAVLGIPFTVKAVIGEAIQKDLAELQKTREELKVRTAVIDELAQITRERARDVESTSAQSKETLSALQPKLAELDAKTVDLDAQLLRFDEGLQARVKSIEARLQLVSVAGDKKAQFDAATQQADKDQRQFSDNRKYEVVVLYARSREPSAQEAVKKLAAAGYVVTSLSTDFSEIPAPVRPKPGDRLVLASQARQGIAKQVADTVGLQWVAVGKGDRIQVWFG